MTNPVKTLKNINVSPAVKEKGIKFIKGSIKIASIALNVLTTVGVLSASPDVVSPTISIIKTPHSVQEIIKNAKRKGLKGSENLKRHFIIASQVLNIGCGVLAGFQIGDIAGTTIAALVSHSIGTGFSILKDSVSAAAPFTVALSGVQIIKTAVDIGIDAIHIHQLNKKIQKIREKKQILQNVDWNDPKYASDKLAHLQAKQLTSEEDLSTLEGSIKTSSLALNSSILHCEKKRAYLAQKKLKLKNKNVFIRLFGKVVPNIKVAIAKSKYKIALKTHEAHVNNFAHLSEAHNKRTIKINSWESIKNKTTAGLLTGIDLELLQTFKTNQLNKLSIKKSNLKLGRLKTSLNILLKTVIIISIVASIALTFSGFGTLPGIITAVTLMLFITAAKYGLKKFDHYKKPAFWTPFAAPTLA